MRGNIPLAHQLSEQVAHRGLVPSFANERSYLSRLSASGWAPRGRRCHLAEFRRQP